MPNNLGLVSIIITCYNQASLIHKAIESVINQKYTHWECYVIDDGSTDNSEAIIRNYQENDNRIHYIFTENGGVAAARNLGFTYCKGEYIQFLDGDDWLLEDKITEQVNLLNSQPDIDICYCNHQYFFEKTKETKLFEFEKLTANPLNQFLYGWHKSVAIPLHAFLYKRSIWQQDELPYPIDYNYREEDWVFNVIIAMKGVRYGFTNKTLCTYFINNQSFTQSSLNSCVNTVKAAYYIKNLLPTDERERFFDETLKKTFIRHTESEKVNILKSSYKWKIGSIISKPLDPLYRIFKHYISKQDMQSLFQ